MFTETAPDTLAPVWDPDDSRRGLRTFGGSNCNGYLHADGRFPSRKVMARIWERNSRAPVRWRHARFPLYFGDRDHGKDSVCCFLFRHQTKGSPEHLFGASEHYQTDISKIISGDCLTECRVTGQHAPSAGHLSRRQIGLQRPLHGQLAALNRAASGAMPMGDYSIITRDDGTKQWAYKGRPLYTWKNDKKPGDITGDGFLNGAWHIAQP
jgi:hypothetical protein